MPNREIFGQIRSNPALVAEFLVSVSGREPLSDLGAFWPPEWQVSVEADFRSGVEHPRQETPASSLVAAVGLELV